MKKLLALLLVFTLLTLSLAACASEKYDGTIRLAGMTGPTSIGMAKLLKDDKDAVTTNDYSFTLVSNADEMQTKFLQGEVDIAAIPANTAATLYQKTNGEIVLLAVNTLGAVSIIEKGTAIQSFADLKGKTIYAPASAKGAIPELVFNYFLKQNGLDPATDVTMSWVTPDKLAPTLKTNADAIILSPQPNATAILNAVEGSREALNLNNEWNALENGAPYITGVVVCRKEFAKKNPAVVDLFLKEYEASIKYANENAADAAALVSEFEILAIAVPMIQKAIPACNLSYIGGEDMKNAMAAYIDLLFDLSPNAFGGKKPDDGFYYISK